jgi:hypothetical protein
VKRNDIRTCECCGQKIVDWKKSVVSVAIASLCKLVNLYEGKAIHLDEFNVKAKDRNFSQLVLWDLATPEINYDNGKRASGKWHPTTRGIDFVNRKITIPKHVVTRNNRLIATIGPNIGIYEALRTRFNYQELMCRNFEDDYDYLWRLAEEGA